MTDFINGQGHKARVKLAAARRDDWSERAEVRRARQEMYAKEAETGRIAAESQAAAEAAETCQCTACGGTGDLTVERAMQVVQAMHTMMSAGRTVSRLDIATLAALARGEPLPPGSPTISFYGSISPAPDAVPHRVETVETIEPVKLSKPSRVKPHDDEGSSFLHDGALVEL